MAATLDNRPRPIGATVGLLFGGLWCVLGAQALADPWRMAAMVLGGAVTLALAVRVWLAPAIAGSGTGMFRQRAYLVAVLLEVAAIALANRVLPHDCLVPAVGVIVGLHFIGLWKATGAARFLSISAAMCMVSAASALLPVGPREAVCGFGNALVLWAFASELLTHRVSG
jgi:hypothetical protein